MKLAFCLFKYFPYGGLQRDFFRIAEACQQRGHTIDVYTMSWDDPIDKKHRNWNIHVVPVSGWQNHSRSRSFIKQVSKPLQNGHYDVVIGFNKMPYLDIYYAADVCYQTATKKRHGWWYRLLPRYQQWVALEKSVFSPLHPTEILFISPFQQAEYTHCYHTPVQRFHYLPPGIDKNRKAPPNAQKIREETRQLLKIPQDHHLLLLVSSGFKTKGLDRILIGLASLPKKLRDKTQLMVAGKDNARTFQQQAEKLGILDQVTFLGGRDDVPALLLAADLLVHPAYRENTGTVLLEAVIAGLPVLTVDVCGYAHYIEKAQAGRVLTSPFQQEAFNRTLAEMLLSPERDAWHKNGLMFAEQADIYSMVEHAVELIEALGRKKQ